MYDGVYSEVLVKKLKKLRKKDPLQFSIVRKKMDSIRAHPQHQYKVLHHDMKGIMRVHLGHFVLVFFVDHAKKIVSFEDYDHHDTIYKKK